MQLSIPCLCMCFPTRLSCLAIVRWLPPVLCVTGLCTRRGASMKTVASESSVVLVQLNLFDVAMQSGSGRLVYPESSENELSLDLVDRSTSMISVTSPNIS